MTDIGTTTTPTVTPRDLLAWTREFLADENRWIKGVSYAGDPIAPSACCLVGALDLARATMGAKRDAVEAAELQLEKLINKSRSEAIWDWNDAPERTHSDVIALLNQAISGQ